MFENSVYRWTNVKDIIYNSTLNVCFLFQVYNYKYNIYGITSIHKSNVLIINKDIHKNINLNNKRGRRSDLFLAKTMFLCSKTNCLMNIRVNLKDFRNIWQL